MEVLVIATPICLHFLNFHANSLISCHSFVSRKCRYILTHNGSRVVFGNEGSQQSSLMQYFFVDSETISLYISHSFTDWEDGGLSATNEVIDTVGKPSSKSHCEVCMVARGRERCSKEHTKRGRGSAPHESICQRQRNVPNKGKDLD